MASKTTSSVYETFDSEELIALARLDMERTHFDEALWKLKRALADTVPMAEALSLGARLYAQLGLRDRARELFERYLSLHPDAFNEKFQLGMVHFDSGRVQDAKTIWEALLKTHNAFPPALFYTALIAANEGNAAYAKQNLETLLKSIPADNLYFNRGKELLQAIEAQRPIVIPAKANGAQEARISAKDAYKTEH